MSVTITQSNKKEDKSLNAGYIQELLKTEGWKIFINEISSMRDEAMYCVLSLDVESVRYRERLKILDKILEIPEILIAESNEIKRQQEDKDGQ